MMHRIRVCSAFFCLMVGLLAFGTAQAARTVQYDGRFAPKFPAVADAGSLGVLNFNGKDGDTFAAVLTASLQSAEIDGHPAMSVKTIEGMNYKSTEDLTRAEIAEAIRLGKKLGVNAVFTGTITSASVAKENFTQQQSSCAKSTKFLKCDQTTTEQIPCEKVSAQYSVTPRVINVSTGALIYSEVVSSQDDYTTCNGIQQPKSLSDLGSNLGAMIFGAKKSGPAQPTTPEQLLQKVRADVADQIRMHIAPYNRKVTVILRDEDATLPKPSLAKLKNALDFAQIGRMDRTCSILQTLFDDTTKTDVTLLYDLGVCQEVLLPDAPSAALEYYAKADELLEKPDKLVSDAYLRTKAMVASQKTISRNSSASAADTAGQAQAKPTSVRKKAANPNG